MNQRMKDELKRQYPKGGRIRIFHMMDEKYGPPAGTLGTILGVDDAGQIHVAWESGGSLAVIPEVDEFELVEEAEA